MVFTGEARQSLRGGVRALSYLQRSYYGYQPAERLGAAALGEQQGRAQTSDCLAISAAASGPMNGLSVRKISCGAASHSSSTRRCSM
jgi:hypothetical protein